MEEQRAWWMPRRLTFWDLVMISAVAAIVCGALTLVSYRGAKFGLPQNDELVSRSGRIVYATLAGRSRSHYTIFRLDTSPTVFSFTGAMGDYARIRERLCLNCEASIWIDPNDKQDRPLAWQIELNGRMIASYPDVKRHWISNGKDAVWMAPVAGAISICFAIWAFRRGRQGSTA